jgi:hypothetical protein
MAIFDVAPKVRGAGRADGAYGTYGADVGRTQERSEQSAIGGMASIQGVGRVQPALFYTPGLSACLAAGCTRPTLSMRSSLQ